MTERACLVTALFVAGALAADPVVIGLGVAGDPVRILKSRVDHSEAAPRPVVMIEIQNAVTVPLSTAQIFLAISSFYTTSEANGNGPRVDHVSTCTLTVFAEREDRAHTIAPGESLTVQLPAGPPCEPNQPNEHFYVYVSQVAVDARYGGAVWNRDARDVPRLLAAAMPYK